jgi:hypothetical protein
MMLSEQEGWEQQLESAQSTRPSEMRGKKSLKQIDRFEIRILIFRLLYLDF